MAEKLATATNAQPPPAKAGQPTGWRKWLYRLLAMTVVPAVLLIVLEWLLCLCGYGYSADFFLPYVIDGQAAFIENQDFGRRFFPPGLVRPPMAIAFPAGKPAGTYRIFILGESAAAGFPDSYFHFGRILQAMLRDRYPNTRFEIVNTAMSSINSHVILPIVRDCADHEPDLFVLYMGNNEVLGPYGASGMFGPYSPSLALCRASIEVKATRTGQLLANLLRRASQSKVRGWDEMAMYLESQLSADDPKLSAIYANFTRNLQDICAVGRQAGAKVVVCTMASNLRDFAPFSSVPAAGLAADQAAAWQKIVAEGIARESARDPAGAVACYRQAEAIDARPADLHFRLARCLAALKEPEEAHRHYVQARDLDTVRFRADTRTNEEIRNTAGGRDDEGIYLADVEQSFENVSPDGSPGDEFFYDHVHLTFEGNYQLARTVLEQIVRLLPDSVRPRQEPPGPFLTLEACKKLLPFTDWNKKRALEDLAPFLRSPPYTNQLDHTEKQQRFRQQLEELKGHLEKGGVQEAVAAYRWALTQSPGDCPLHHDYAQLLLEQGDGAEGIRQLQEALKQMPHMPILHSQLAEVFLTDGKLDQAFASCSESLRLKPDAAQFHNIMGKILLAQGKPDQAALSFKQALKTHPEAAVIHVNLGDAMALQKQFVQAAAEYNEALRLDSNCILAHYQLARMFKSSGRLEVAQHHVQESLRIDPKNAQFHAELAEILLKQGQVASAIAHLEEALRLRPNWTEAEKVLHELRLRVKKTP